MNPLHPLSLNYATMYYYFLARLTAGEAAISTSNPVSKEEAQCLTLSYYVITAECFALSPLL